MRMPGDSKRNPNDCLHHHSSLLRFVPRDWLYGQRRNWIGKFMKIILCKREENNQHHQNSIEWLTFSGQKKLKGLRSNGVSMASLYSYIQSSNSTSTYTSVGWTAHGRLCAFLKRPPRDARHMSARRAVRRAVLINVLFSYPKKWQSFWRGGFDRWGFRLVNYFSISLFTFHWRDGAVWGCCFAVNFPLHYALFFQR